MRFHRARARARAALGLGAILSLASATAQGAVPNLEELQQELATTQQELARTQGELAATRGLVDALTQRMDALQAAQAAAPGGEAPAQAGAAAPAVLAAAPAAAPETTARLAPVNVDNPAISFVVDTGVSADTGSSYQSIGYPDGVGFELKSAELFISAPIDPFLRGYAAIVASSEEGFDVEEAALVTTALPGNFTVKGGRFFADVGRLSSWHGEALPFVDRPPSIDRIVGGESGSEGAEVSWLAPIDHFVELTGGVYNAVGVENLEAVNEDGFFGRRSFEELTYLARLHTYVDLTDTFNAELGGTWVGIPQGSERNLGGLDVTLRHQPGTSGFYQGFVWGTEWLFNDQRFTERDDDGLVVDRMRERRHGGYTYAEVFLGRSTSTGVRFDTSESPEGASDLAQTISAFVTWKPSEFHRLRFQLDNTWGDQDTNQRFTLQWTAFIGSHSHGFAQR